MSMITAENLRKYILTEELCNNLREQPIVPIIKDMIHKGEHTLVVGETAVGKTRFGTQLAISGAIQDIASNTFLNHYALPQPFSTIMIQAEMDDRSYLERVDTMLKGLPNVTLSDVLKRICWLRNSNREMMHFQNNQLKEFIEVAAETIHQDYKDDPLLIIIDPVISFLKGADENSSVDIRRNLNWIIDIADSANATLIIFHHSGKNNKTGIHSARGSSDFAATFFNKFSLGKDSNGIFLTCDKCRSRVVDNTKIRLISESNTGLFSIDKPMSTSALTVITDLIANSTQFDKKNRPIVEGKKNLEDELVQKCNVRKYKASNLIDNMIENNYIYKEKGKGNTHIFKLRN